MKRNTNVVSGLLLATMAIGTLLSGCGNNASVNGTEPQGMPNKPTASQIEAVKNNPNIPADKKAGIIAAMTGEKVSSTPIPDGIAPAGQPSKAQ